MLKNPRERFLAFVGIPVALIILIWSFISPSGTSATKGKLLSTYDAQQKYDKDKSELKAMDQDENVLKPQVSSMSYEVPADELVPRMIRDLQAISDKAGVHLREVKPLRPKLLKSGGGASVPVEVRFRARIQPDAVRFLYFVEDPDGRMVVDKINVSSADPKQKVVDVSAQITAFTRSTTGVAGADGGDTSDVSDKSTKS